MIQDLRNAGYVGPDSDQNAWVRQVQSLYGTIAPQITGGQGPGSGGPVIYAPVTINPGADANDGQAAAAAFLSTINGAVHSAVKNRTP